jgi:hypothetical protein
MCLYFSFKGYGQIQRKPESCKSIPDADVLVLDGHNNVPGQNPCLDYMHANHKINYYICDTI